MTAPPPTRPGAGPDESRPALFTAAFVRLSLADLVYFSATGVAIYALPAYVTGPVGSDEAAAGLAFGAFAVTALVLRPFAGRLSDTRGRRPLLVGGALLASVAMFLTAFAETVPLIVALRLLFGAAEAAFFVASFAALADLAPATRMGEALSYNSLGLYLGLTLGPPLGELLVSTIGFTGAWYGAAALLVIAAAVVSSIGETRAPSEAPEAKAPLIHRPALPAALGLLTSILPVGGFLAFAALYARDVGVASSSLPLAVYGLVVVVCRVAFAKVPDRLPALPLGAVSLLVIGVGLGLPAVSATPTGLLIGAALMGLGVSFSTPAFFTAIFATASASQRGAASGTASAMLDVGLGGGPIILGLVAESLGINGAFGVGAAIALTGCLWTLALARRLTTA
ncbi:MFS transporter [Nocardioides abyssi]|uniref:MFS transporter n=1 Tax=Nocardioides abyssi TaxID=3058370 RepID=A0ABT8EZ25_9ACTN|nr:MFS transporter [Nocardioides abyssi]MDN4163437.1 MFS transporter [Nocardioides abyssi]